MLPTAEARPTANLVGSCPSPGAAVILDVNGYFE